ncbi:uncharacterized protein LOC135496910 [Lineus longissimus]|uniref:uncharacterized protein LOC135496910 n=1 Tax=Lineus longissimus TaxID=88925 RepID=UPI00315CE6ED
MASNGQHQACEPACPICLDTQTVLKVISTCKHAFCRGCLRNCLEKQDLASGCIGFKCPTCLIECPLPSGGVDGLMDSTEVGHADTDELGILVPGSSGVQENDECCEEENVSCDRCLYKSGAVVEAGNFCEECGNLYFCADCIHTHRRAKATKDHVVVTLEKGARGRKCIPHKKWIKHYCITCSTAVCQLCIVLDHGDHELKEFEEAFQTFLEDVISAKKEIESRANYLKDCANELKGMQQTAATMKTTLVNKIESRAERCVEEIMIQKEALKETVKNDFKEVACAEENLDKIPGLVETMEKYVAKADRLLQQAKDERYPQYMQALSKMSWELKDASRSSAGIDREAYLTSYTSYWQSCLEFVPGKVDFSIGTLSQRKALKPLDIKHCQLVFEQKLVVDDEAKYIPCVANLGNDFFAVAHPTLSGKQSEAINIYKVPGVLHRTLKYNVRPLYDMAATPEGKLATLADGENSQCIQVFDPETGYLIRTTKDLPNQGHFAIAINMSQQFVTLREDLGRKIITAYKEDGSVVLSHIIDVSTVVKDASRIACSAGYIYVMGANAISAYEQRGQQLVRVTTSEGVHSRKIELTDISTIAFGEIYFGFNFQAENRRLFFGQLTIRDAKISGFRSIRVSEMNAQGAERVSRISVRENYNINSQGQTIRVYKLNE